MKRAAKGLLLGTIGVMGALFATSAASADSSAGSASNWTVPTMAMPAASETAVEGTPAQRPALAFELGRTGRRDVANWAAANDAACSTTAMGRLMRCSGVSAEALGPVIDELVMHFDANSRLVAVDALRKDVTRTTAETRFSAARAKLDLEVGNATTTINGDDDAFVPRPYERAVADYRYAGYQATITATNFGKRGIQLRERYVAR
jgi:hypothetical protein